MNVGTCLYFESTVKGFGIGARVRAEGGHSNGDRDTRQQSVKTSQKSTSPLSFYHIGVNIISHKSRCLYSTGF